MGRTSSPAEAQLGANLLPAIAVCADGFVYGSRGRSEGPFMSGWRSRRRHEVYGSRRIGGTGVIRRVLCVAGVTSGGV